MQTSCHTFPGVYFDPKKINTKDTTCRPSGEGCWMDSLEDGLPCLSSLMNQANFLRDASSKTQETSHKMSPVTSRNNWSYYRITPINGVIGIITPISAGFTPFFSRFWAPAYNFFWGPPIFFFITPIYNWQGDHLCI